MALTFGSFIATLSSFIQGSRLVDGGDCLALAKMVCGVNPAVTARAGGGAALATPLSYGFTKVSVVATNADSVLLPPAIPGATVSINNVGASTLQVFGQQANQGGAVAGDTITPNNSVAAVAVATGVAQATAIDAEYKCYEAGNWKQSLSA